MPIRKIFIFRHGITEWNLATRFQGHSDIPLHEEGIRQAHELRPFVEALDPQIILSSDLQRAIHTAKIVNQSLSVPLLIDSRLREYDLGKIEGLTRDEVKQVVGPDGWAQWQSVDHQHIDFAFPGGETKKQLLDRAKGFLERFILNHPAQRIAVSCHGGIVKTLSHAIADLPSESIPIPNCCLYELQFNHSNLEWSFHGSKR